MFNNNCRLCGSTNTEVLYTRKFKHIKNVSFIVQYNVCVCNSCGFGFAGNIPEQSAFNEYYKEMSKYESTIEYTKALKIALSAYIDVIAKYLPEKFSVIYDIGCATSDLLSKLRKRGYSCLTGVDPSPECAAYINNQEGIRGVCASIDNLSVSEKVDGCLLTSVLEHIHALNTSMRKINSVLSDSGYLFVMVPDASLFNADDEPPFQEFSIEHINFFRETSLSNLAKINNFEQIETIRIPEAVCLISIMRKLQTAGGVDFDNKTKESLQAYILSSKAAEKRIEEKLSPFYGKEVIVWGAGTLARHLLANGILSKCRIIAVVDKDPHYTGGIIEIEESGISGSGISGTEISGTEIPVITPGDLNVLPQIPIIIATRRYQEEITREIRNEYGLLNPIVTLF